MATITINDPSLKMQILGQIVTYIGQGSIEHLLNSGVPAELIDHLRSKYTLQDLAQLSRQSKDFGVEFDSGDMLSCILSQTRVQERHKRLEYLAIHGATREQLTSWFSITREAAANIGALSRYKRTGRPKLPDAEACRRIVKAFQQLPSGMTARDAYYDLHHQFPEYSVASLHLAVCENADESWVKARFRSAALA